MLSTKTLGALALVLATTGCSSSSSNGTPETGNLGVGGSAGGEPSSGGGEPTQCGGEAEKCCSSGSLCSVGLTCSDEFCLACGPAPAGLTGCSNVAITGTASGATAAGAPSDDAKKVIDDDVCTSWNYGGYGSADAFWQVDLGSSQALEALTLWPKMTPADGDVTFHIQYKEHDSDAFIDYPSASGLTLTLHDYHPWQTTFAPAISARYFRITIVNTPSYAALREVGLYTGCTQ